MKLGILRDFYPVRGREEGAYPQRSVTDEQQSSGKKAPKGPGSEL
jgi:hypothetical protein